MIIRLGNDPPRTAGQCVTCGIVKRNPAQPLCDVCGWMAHVVFRFEEDVVQKGIDQYMAEKRTTPAYEFTKYDKRLLKEMGVSE